MDYKTSKWMLYLIINRNIEVRCTSTNFLQKQQTSTVRDQCFQMNIAGYFYQVYNSTKTIQQANKCMKSISNVH